MLSCLLFHLLRIDNHNNESDICQYTTIIRILLAFDNICQYDTSNDIVKFPNSIMSINKCTHTKVLYKR